MMQITNEYICYPSQIREVIRHTDIEYTFRMAYEGAVRPGQFFEVSLPKYGEAPISVSGIGDGYIDLTIRRVGRVTNEVFEQYTGNALYIRGPYGNGFHVDDYNGKELLVIAGGTGLSPVRGVIEHFCSHPEKIESLTLLAGFKSPDDILFQKDLETWKKTAAVILTLDNGSAPELNARSGMVTKHIPHLQFNNIKSAVAIVVGPPPMMHFSCLRLLDIGFKEEHIWISHERKMCCGVGKCGHCKINDQYVCLDGPVFKYSQGTKLID